MAIQKRHTNWQQVRNLQYLIYACYFVDMVQLVSMVCVCDLDVNISKIYVFVFVFVFVFSSGHRA